MVAVARCTPALALQPSSLGRGPCSVRAAYNQSASCTFAARGHVLAPTSRLAWLSPRQAGGGRRAPGTPGCCTPAPLHQAPLLARLGSSSPVQRQSAQLAATTLIYKRPCNSQALTRKKQNAAGLYGCPQRIELLCKLIRSAVGLFFSPKAEYCFCARDGVKLLLGGLFYNVQ